MGNKNFELFLKVHGCDILTEEKISVDVEVVVLEGNHTVPGQAVVLSMNGKSHALATMANGKLRGELIFPLRAEAMQQISAILEAHNGLGDSNVSAVMFFPTGCNHDKEEAGAMSQESILSGKRPIFRGEILTLLSGFYEITGNIKVERGGKLNIHAGCTLEFAPQAGIVCEGVMEAIGSVEEKITFTASMTYWRNILIYGRHTAGTRMEHCLIEHGGGRVLVKDALRGIYIPVARESDEEAHHGGGLQLLHTQKAEISLSHLVIRENTAKNGYGGGMYIYESAPLVTHVEISNNNSGRGGGGLYIGGTAGFEAELNHLFIHHNVSLEDGGGIYLDRVAPFFSQSEINDNEARFGGGMYHEQVSPEDLRFTHCTFNENISSHAPDDPEGVAGSWPDNL